MPAITRNRGVTPVSQSATSPLPFSDYMRTIYRVTQEGALEQEDQRQNVLKSHPDLAQLASCVSSDTANTECRVKLGEGYIDQGLLWSAYSLFNDVLKLKPDDFRSTIGLARIWDRWKDYSVAQRLAAAAVAMNPESAVAHELLGNIELHLNMPARALVEFKKSLDLDPANDIVTSNLGYAEMILHNWPDAKAAFEKALSLNPNLAETRNNLGIVLAQLGDYEGAIAQMQQVGGPAVAYNNVGVVLLAFKKEPAAAVQAFEQALRYAPGYEKARLNLATARAQLPPPVVINLPPRQKTEHELTVSPPVTGTHIEKPGAPEPDHVSESTVLPLRIRLAPELIQRDTRLDGRRPTAHAGGSVVEPTDHVTATRSPGDAHAAFVRSTGSANSPREQIVVYGLLAVVGILVMTSVTSRCLFARI